SPRAGSCARRSEHRPRRRTRWAMRARWSWCIPLDCLLFRMWWSSAVVHGHGQWVGGAQHELVLGPGVGDVFRSEGEPSAELVEDHRGLVVGVGGSDAVAVSGAERDVGITVS